MKVIICVDDRGGVSYHGRRLSQDRLQRIDVIQRFASHGFCMKKETADLYHQIDKRCYQVIPAWKQVLSSDRWWVSEDIEFLQWLDQLEELVIYRWNRLYPSDKKLLLSLPVADWRCILHDSFVGSSHAKIDVEHYVKGNG